MAVITLSLLALACAPMPAPTPSPSEPPLPTLLTVWNKDTEPLDVEVDGRSLGSVACGHGLEVKDGRDDVGPPPWSVRVSSSGELLKAFVIVTTPGKVFAIVEGGELSIAPGGGSLGPETDCST